MITESISNLTNQTAKIRVFDVDYYHLSLQGGDDLYITEHGLPFIENLLPENYWTDKEWFKTHSEKLRGTSTLYKITTKEINSKSNDIVLKWNRMGQDIPGSFDLKELNIEFNSPFDEFAFAHGLVFHEFPVNDQAVDPLGEIKAVSCQRSENSSQ